MPSPGGAKAALAFAMAALALAGCGPFGGSSDEDNVRDAVTELVDAGNAHDFARACELLTADRVKSIEKGSKTSCEEALGAVAGNTDTNIRIDEVRVNGDRATVDATVGRAGEAGQPQSILLVKENDQWKVAEAGF